MLLQAHPLFDMFHVIAATCSDTHVRRIHTSPAHLNIPICVEQQIFWLQISVDDLRRSAPSINKRIGIATRKCCHSMSVLGVCASTLAVRLLGGVLPLDPAFLVGSVCDGKAAARNKIDTYRQLGARAGMVG
eukprot:scaffold206118_cov35-Tisochrysis_lutea.AAC.3